MEWFVVCCIRFFECVFCNILVGCNLIICYGCNDVYKFIWDIIWFFVIRFVLGDLILWVEEEGVYFGYGFKGGEM